MNNGCYKKKIGILGGTFNPIHVGHLILAQNALECCALEKVLIIPTGCSYLKDQNTIEDVRHRVNMVDLAIEDNKYFELSTIETEREGNSYTYETLELLCKEDPDARYYYIVGADTLLFMDKWKKPEEIFKRCKVVCAKRIGHSDKELTDKAAYLKDRFDADIMIMDFEEFPVSSTELRERLAKGQSCRYYLDDKVIRYIKDNGLYGNDSDKR